MKQYLDLLKDVIDNGEDKENRTAVPARSIFGRQMRFDMRDGFPLLTTRKMNWDNIKHELVWMLAGDTNIKYLNDNGVHIWDAWANEDGDLGPIYGTQWRDRGPDQIDDVVNLIKNNPNSRRIIIDSWRPEELPSEDLSPQENVDDGLMALAPCCCLLQFYVSSDKLSLQVYQRSCDVFVGLPHNIATYALLLHMVASVTKKKAHELVWTGGDIHLYDNNKEQADKLLSRIPIELPELVIYQKSNIFDYQSSDLMICGYYHRGAIKTEMLAI